MNESTLTFRNSETKKQNSNYEQITCPYCHSIHALKYRNTNDIVKCLNCGIVYLRTRLNKDAMKKLYQAYNTDAPQMFLPKNNNEIKTSLLRRDYWMKEIVEYLNVKDKCLDIGCGWGAFLENAKSYGFTPRGIEITKKGADFAKEKLNINATSEQFLDTPFNDNYFSLVTLNHVLEHLPEPKEALDKIFNILIPDGMFCGIVPNINSLCSTFTLEGWEWLDADYHYVHYSPITLKQQLEKAGFIVEKIYTVSGDYNRQQLNEVIKKYYRPQSENLYAEVIHQIENDGMGEEIRFLARKPKPVTMIKTCSEWNIKSSANLDSKPVVSIIIPVFNKVEYTQQCLESIYGTENGIKEFEVIVVNNASTDETNNFLNFALKVYENFKVITSSKNLKFAGACNLGSQNALGKYLVFLNNDTIPTTNWLSAGINRLLANKEIGIVGSKLVYSDDTIQHAGIEFVSNMHPEYDLWPVHRYLNLSKDDPLTNKDEFVDAVTGACLFISTELFNAVNGFSEEYEMYFEDSDLCFKVKAYGKKIFYEPSSMVYHYEGKSNTDEPKRHQQNYKASKLFFKNWADTIALMSQERMGRKLFVKEPGNYNLSKIQKIEISKNLAKTFLVNSRITEAENILNNISKLFPHYPGVNELIYKIKIMKNPSKLLEDSDCIIENQNFIDNSQNDENTRVSIVVPLYNNLLYTKEFMHSVTANTTMEYEIIFIDNASIDKTIEYLKSVSTSNQNVKVIFNEINLGFPAAVNQGIQIAKGKYIVIANNDIVCTDGWLERLIEVAESDGRIGIVGPISNEVSGVQKDKEANYKTIDEMHVYAASVKEKNRNSVMQFPRVAFLCTLIKREVINIIGGLDERFTPGNYEDDDYCLRAQLAGFKTVIAQDVFIHHYGSKSFKAEGEKKYAERLKINHQIFVNKWGADPDEIWLKQKSFYHSRSLFISIDKDEFIKSFERAQNKIKDKEYDLALNELELSIEYFESSDKAISIISREDLYSLTANISLIVKNLEKAKSYFEEALKLNPASSDACFGLGQVFYQAEMFEESKTMIEWAVKNNPQNAKAIEALKSVNEALSLPENHNSLFENVVEQVETES
jgi:GT2 family glycosyltransferase/ubiquinone/menaquinone biosynthesis C-methylase UbiE